MRFPWFLHYHSALKYHSSFLKFFSYSIITSNDFLFSHVNWIIYIDCLNHLRYPITMISTHIDFLSERSLVPYNVVMEIVQFLPYEIDLD